MNDYIKILTDSSIVINRVVQLLDEEKIPSPVKDHVEFGRLGGFGTTTNDVELYVYKSDINRAEKTINLLWKKRIENKKLLNQHTSEG